MPGQSLDLADAERECGDGALARVRRACPELAPGEPLTILTGVAEQAFAVRAWARKAGMELVEETRVGGRSRLVIRRPDR